MVCVYETRKRQYSKPSAPRVKMQRGEDKLVALPLATQSYPHHPAFFFTLRPTHTILIMLAYYNTM